MRKGGELIYLEALLRQGGWAIRRLRVVVICLASLIAAGALAQSKDPVENSDKRVDQPQPVEVIVVETPEQSARAVESEQKAHAHAAAELQAQQLAAQAAQSSADSSEKQNVAAYAQVVTAVVSLLVAAGALFLSLLAMKRSETTTKQQLRAYVGMFQAAVTAIHADGRAEAAVSLKNFGPTPAQNVRAGFIVAWRQVPLTEDSFTSQVDPMSNPIVSKSALFPDVVQTVRFFTSGGLQGATQLYAAGTLALVVFGSVEYEDAFGAQRVTNLKLFRTHDVADGVLRHFSSGNDAT